VEEEMPCKTQRRPRTSITPENIAVGRDLIEGDRRLTVVEICQERGTRISYGKVHSIIKHELVSRKISARWVPRLLSDKQKTARVQISETLLAQMYWTALEHPPYSPNLSPGDYHMFGPLKESQGGQHFDDDEQVENCVRKWLQTRPPSFYDAGIKKLPIRWQKCIEKGGNYVEK
jgi:hypothetical protein